ncbi:MAG: substrate-binding domain-containing protein, partial [Actinobacteria bacterium]|nr:substrate-binding domain-containing protein [Actinomycetota bacterium]
RERLAVLRQACGGPLTWRCLGDAAGRGTWKANRGPDAWGLVKVALADPVTESDGLAGLAAVTFGFKPELATGVEDPAQNDDFQRWLTGLARAIPHPTPPLATVLAAGPAVADVYIGLEANVDSVLRTSARRAEMEVVYLPPVIEATAVLVSPGRAAPGGLREALAPAGWDRRRPTPGALPLATAKTLVGLRTLWRDSVR